MIRNKVKLSYIVDESKRNESYKTRKNGLIKKIDEISTLCGIEACAIIYGSNEPQPEVWPSHSRVQSVINKFKTMTEVEQRKNMFDQESFLNKSITKAQEQLKKLRDENKKKEMELFMFQCLSNGGIVNNVNKVDMNYLLWVINQTLKDIESKYSRVQPQHGTILAACGSEALNGETALVDGHVQGMMHTDMGAMQRQEWSFDSSNGGGNEMLPFGDYNLPNGFGHYPSFP